MSIRKQFFIILTLLSANSLIAIAAQDPKETAGKFVDLLAQKQYSKAVQCFDPAMTQALPAAKLQQAWEALISQNGAFQKQLACRSEKFQQYDIVFVTCQFEKGIFDVKVVLNAFGKTAGLFFVPSQYTGPISEDSLPAYADPNAFTEKDIQLGKDPWILPGTLTLPKGKESVAAVILVHGSGPQDRDETIGPNKPFRDLAVGLASRGIAVLRYEKRTKQYPLEMSKIKNRITVQVETIDDVLAAAEFLRSQPSIDPKRIYAAGHSLGGILVPRIAQQDKKLAGFIILAGTSRPMEDVILEQFHYIFSLDGTVSEEETKQLTELKKQVARVKSADLTENTPAKDLPLGAPAAYWLDLRNYQPAREAAKIEVPILICQGQRDYQVTMDDFKGWQEALSSRKNVQFKLYPDLNHLFMKGQGKCTPSEYEKAGHVDEHVIHDIADWIFNQSKD